MKAIIKKLIKTLMLMYQGKFFFMNSSDPGWLWSQAPFLYEYRV